MFGLGWMEILIIGVLALIIVGPKQLPEVLKAFAKFIRQLNGLRDDWAKAIREDKSLQEIQRSVNEVKDSVHRPLKKEVKGFEEAIEEATEIYRPGEKPDDSK